ncbi:Re/Si-specific NAD(P)(+) transhydrogenase subunit alpha [Actinomyces israelii]|uniref:proton-translocating NAD(P)(+) transhydrogenase n=1 Tax=Actinomyces israelii TaxID=1659 RepID=A0ABT4I4F3_9ACTO|nr:Re/Si-specific NAD(P)(+) transhydrogenase subunit alpha [Actinomyces israelii]MCZ0856618.1 Re/Si-specific NAD(P)(+) transhydrogenase subunit alpha [Actinomyces israelii]
MDIGVPHEQPEQAPIAATPQSVEKLVSLGYTVRVERGAGTVAHIPDDDYREAGADLVDAEAAWGCEVVLAAHTPSSRELGLMRRGAVLISRLDPARRPGLLENLRARDLTALAVDAVPRLSRAQAMDVLSSQANLAGYRAVIEAAAHLGRPLGGQVTAAGKFEPARVYVIGAGVAGLAGIGAARSLGAVVRGTDVRPEVAEQVESMGASFVPLPAAQEESRDGYATEMATDQAAAAAALYADEAAQADVVITTAAIPGRRAPLLLDREAVEGMRPGSVVIDMAAGTGGNTELTVPGRVVTTGGGVAVVGLTDLASRLPLQSSLLYSQNLVNLLDLMTPAGDGALALDLDDEVVRTITVCHDGEILWPPPPVSVSAAPSAAGGPAEAEQPGGPDAAEAPVAQDRPRSRRRRIVLGLVVALAAALVLITPAAATSHYIVLALSIILGFHVISNVTPALHTPLMSVTNAISGIILLGAISQIGNADPRIAAVAFAATVLATINVFGGFAVTHRMLAMFRKG